MNDDLRERVAQVIENLRGDSGASSVEIADAALAEMGEISVRDAARVLLDAARIEPVYDAIVRSVHLTPFCAALRAIAEGKE